MNEIERHALGDKTRRAVLGDEHVDRAQARLTEAAIRNGVTLQELKELFLHSAIYCRLPAANAAYHCAEEVLAELQLPSQKKGPPEQGLTKPD